MQDTVDCGLPDAGNGKQDPAAVTLRDVRNSKYSAFRFRLFADRACTRLPWRTGPYSGIRPENTRLLAEY